MPPPAIVSSASAPPLSIGNDPSRLAWPVATAFGPGAATPRRLLQCVLDVLRAHTLFIGVILAYMAAGGLTPRLLDVPFDYAPGLYSLSLMVIAAAFLAIAAAVYVVRVMIVARPPDLFRYLRVNLLGRILTPERVAGVLLVLLLLPIVMSTFTYLKFVIPFIQPFHLDPLLADWDRALHGGQDPWQLLQPVLGHPYVSSALNLVYHSWFFVMFGVLLWQSGSLSQPRLRMRYLLTFMLLWALLGNLAATLLSSAGPVYFARVTGLADPFAPLMAYLHDAGGVAWLPALQVQDMLWQGYLGRSVQLGLGISALPSLHVATSFSFALLGFAVDRRLGIVFSIFTFLILIGSVHLGWHYAIDGYAAILAAWLIWLGVGWLLGRPAVAWLLWGSAAPEEPRLPAA